MRSVAVAVPRIVNARAVAAAQQVVAPVLARDRAVAVQRLAETAVGRIGLAGEAAIGIVAGREGRTGRTGEQNKTQQRQQPKRRPPRPTRYKAVDAGCGMAGRCGGHH